MLSQTITTPKERIMQALDLLPAQYWADVLQFIRFLEYQYLSQMDAPEEDESLWQAVQAHQRYHQEHIAEQPEEYASGAAFLKGVADL